MKYRYFTNGKGQTTIQRKRWFGWQWLDSTNAWCNWYGKNHPKIYESLEEARNSTYELVK